jgi:hypothetical protein
LGRSLERLVHCLGDDEIARLKSETGLPADDLCFMEEEIIYDAWNFTGLNVPDAGWSAYFDFPAEDSCECEDESEYPALVVIDWSKVRTSTEIDGPFDPAKLVAEWQSRSFAGFEFTLCKLRYDGRPLEYPWGFDGDRDYYYVDKDGRATEVYASFDEHQTFHLVEPIASKSASEAAVNA